MKKKKYLAIFMAMSMATATAPVTALADDATTGTESVQRQAKAAVVKLAVQVKLAVKMAAQKAVAQQHLIHLPKTKVLRLLIS